MSEMEKLNLITENYDAIATGINNICAKYWNDIEAAGNCDWMCELENIDIEGLLEELYEYDEDEHKYIFTHDSEIGYIRELIDKYTYKNEDINSLIDKIDIYIKEDFNMKETLEKLQAIKFIPKRQKNIIAQIILNGEEKEHFAQIVDKVDEIIKNAPNIGETDGQKDKKPVLHYFYGSYDSYALELDKETGEMFGYVNLGYGFELGYFSIDEINTVPQIELDLYFDNKLPNNINESVADYITQAEAKPKRYRMDINDVLDHVIDPMCDIIDYNLSTLNNGEKEFTVIYDNGDEEDSVSISTSELAKRLGVKNISWKYDENGQLDRIVFERDVNENYMTNTITDSIDYTNYKLSKLKKGLNPMDMKRAKLELQMKQSKNKEKVKEDYEIPSEAELVSDGPGAASYIMKSKGKYYVYWGVYDEGKEYFEDGGVYDNIDDAYAEIVDDFTNFDDWDEIEDSCTFYDDKLKELVKAEFEDEDDDFDEDINSLSDKIDKMSTDIKDMVKTVSSVPMTELLNELDKVFSKAEE